MKRSTTDALREELRAAQANVARLARECAALRERGAEALREDAEWRRRVANDGAIIRDLQERVCATAAERDAARRDAADLRTSRDLAEAAGAKTLALLDAERVETQRLMREMEKADTTAVGNAVNFGHLKGITYVLTRLVLAGDLPAAQAVAQGIAGMVTP